MNFLAHLLLSENDVEFRLGNFLADFVKGKQRALLQGNMRRGLECHRRIDRFTDSHPSVFRAMDLIDPSRRRFAGILVDVFFDNLLANTWNEYAHTPLDEFCASIYKAFQDYAGPLPPDARRIIGRMIEFDWLRSYQHIEGIDQAIERIRRVLGHDRTEPLAGASADLLARRADFAEHFRVFFPELREHVKEVYDINP